MTNAFVLARICFRRKKYKLIKEMLLLCVIKYKIYLQHSFLICC